MTPFKGWHTFFEPHAWLSFLDSVNSKPICHLIQRSVKHAFECIWQQRKKKQSDFWSVAVSSWLHQQLSSSAVTRVCVYICVCVDRVQAALRETVMGQLSAALYCCCKYTKHIACPSSWPCAPSLWPCPHFLYLILSVFLLLMLSVCSDNCDPALCIITPPPPTKKKPTSSLISLWEHTKKGLIL